MYNLKGSDSLRSHREDVVYLEAALAADEQTKGLAGPVARVIGLVEQTEGKERETAQRLTQQNARVAVADAKLDARVVSFGNKALAAAGFDRADAAYRKFFPHENPSAVARLPYPDEIERVKGICDEAEKLPAKDPLRADLKGLKDGADGLVDALDARRKARQARALQSVEAAEVKEAVGRVRWGTYGELQRIGSEERLGRNWADAFFRPAASTGRTDEEVETIDEAGPTTPVATAPATGPAPVNATAPGTPSARTPGENPPRGRENC